MVAELYRLRGKIDFQLNNLKDSITAYERSLLVNALDPVVHYELAMVLCSLSRFGEAIAALRKCLELSPEFSEARSYYEKLRQDYGEA